MMRKERSKILKNAFRALVLCCSLSMNIVPGASVVSAATSGDYTYTLTSGAVKITKYNGTATVLEIPDTIEGNPVTSIGSEAFNYSSLTSVTIPDSVTSIGTSAFRNSRSLTSVTISVNVTGIGDSVFRNCDKLADVTIPDNVKSIGADAFNGCSNLTSITIPTGATSIGARAFESCTKLETATIPGSVTSIGDSAFNNCKTLTLLVEKDSCAEQYAKDNGIEITITSNNTHDDTEKDDGDYNYAVLADGTVEITGYNGATKELEIPKKIGGKMVTCIGDYAFSKCSSLTKVTIPEGVTTLGSHAFYECRQLEELSIPASVTDIKDDVFSRCGKLAVITVADGNTVYDSRNGCNAVIKTATDSLIIGCHTTKIPDDVKELGFAAFSGCNTLTEIVIPASVTAIEDGVFWECSGLTEVTIPASVVSFGAGVFYGCSSLGEVTIPEGITSIGWGVFYGCSSLVKADLPEELTGIGEWAFYGCGSLEDITLPQSVESIGECAFWGCSSLEEVTIPKNVINIYGNPFAGCSGLTAITVATENAVYDSRNNCNAIISKDRDFLVTGCQTTEIPSTVKWICYNAFEGCRNLKKVTIPVNVMGMDAYAFLDCAGLGEVVILNSEIEIDADAFSGCSNFVIIAAADSKAAEYAEVNGIRHAAPHTHSANEDDGDCTTAITCSVCGVVVTEAYASHIGGTATCTEVASCKRCGKKYGDLDPANHSPNDDDGDCTTAITCSACGKVTTAAYASHEGGTATCAKKATCERCGKEYGKLDATKHVPDKDDGDCTTAITCLVCGEITTAAYASHEGGGTATCTEKASCERCGKEYGKLDTTKHSPNEDDGDCTTAITCSACGEVTTAAYASHIGGTATCTEKASCERCGKEYGEFDTTNHSPNEDDGDCTTAITCSACGKVAIAAYASHTGGTATCAKKASCERCGTEYGELDASHHVPNKDDGDCTTAITCSMCGEVTTAAHASHTGGTATCAKKASCERCGMEYGELDASYHVPNKDDGDCTTAITCSMCGQALTTAYANHIGGIATCTEKARCERCSKEYGGLNAGNHSGRMEVRNAREVTETSAGYTGDIYCSACNILCESGKVIEIPSDGETYNVDGLIYKITSLDKKTVSCIGWENEKTEAASLVIPSNIIIGKKIYTVTAIESKAFSNKKNLTSVDIGDAVKEIGDSAFEGSDGIEKVTIGKGVVRIGSKAFYKCKNLKELVLNPTKLTSIGKDAFKETGKLTYSGNNKKLAAYKKIMDGSKKKESILSGNIIYQVTNANKKTVKCVGVEKQTAKVTIPSSIKAGSTSYKVTEIGSSAFKNDKKVTKITLQSTNLTTIGSSAFCNCKKLKQLTIKSTKLKKVGKNAFKGCKMDVTVPTQMTDKYTKLFKGKW